MRIKAANAIVIRFHSTPVKAIFIISFPSVYVWNIKKVYTELSS